MTPRHFVIACSLLLSLTLSPLLAQPAKPESKPERPEHTELGKTMSTLNAAWRKLRRQAGDATLNASSAELVATIKAATEKSLTLAPDKASDLPAAEREKFIQAYQARMKKFLTEVDRLAAAFKAGDNAGAQEIIKTLGAMQRDDHKEFRRPEM